MPQVSIGDAELYYEIHGEGAPVLLVAGLGGAGAYWQPQIAPFAKRFRTVVHDHRGTGQSTFSRIRYSVEQMTADLVALMDRLGIDSAYVVGHSTGGAIGQVMALDYPDRLRGLVIYASWTKADPFMHRVMEIRRTLALDAGGAAYVRATPVFLYPSWWVNENSSALEAADVRGASSFPPVEIAASRIDGILAFDRASELARIHVPTLVICAEDDFLTPAYYSRALAEAIPGAKLSLLPRGGHAVSQVCPDEFNRVVLDYLDTLEAASRS